MSPCSSDYIFTTFPRQGGKGVWRVVSEDPPFLLQKVVGFLLIVRTEQIVTAPEEASTVGYNGFSSIQPDFTKAMKLP